VVVDLPPDAKRSGRTVELTRQHVVGVLRRAGLVDEAQRAQESLPETVEFDELMEILGEHGITKDSLISLLGGSP
jgi:hypothetical protein